MLTGYTQKLVLLSGKKIKDITWLKGVNRNVAGQIHRNLVKKRTAGDKIRNWWFYEEEERFVIQWAEPLFGR